MASGNAHFEISRHPALGCRGKGASFNQDVDSAVFSINSSACGAQPPLLPFWQHPSVHQFTATVEIQGTSTQRLAHCFVFLFQSSVCEQHFPVLPPQKVKFLAAPLGETAGLCSPPSAGRHTEGQSSRGGSVQCLTAVVAGVYQLALTASMSLTKFCARHIPKICSNAMPMKIPATMVKLSWSHFSNWGTQPFV